MQQRGAADAGAKNRFFVYTLPDSGEGEPLGEMGRMGLGRAKWGRPPVLEYVGGGFVDATVEELRIEAERSDKEAREEARKKSHKIKKKTVVVESGEGWRDGGIWKTGSLGERGTQHGITSFLLQCHAGCRDR